MVTGLDNVHILFHRSTPWENEIQCSTKTFASLFSELGYETTYFQDMIHPGHYFLRRGYYHTWKRGCRYEGRVWVASTMSLSRAFCKPFRFSSIMGAINYRSCIPSISNVVRRSGFESPHIIWSTKPGSSELKRIFPNSKLIMNVVDYYPAFHGNAIKRLEQNDYQLADHVFVIGETLKRYLIRELEISPEKITVLGQGVAEEPYQRSYSCPAELLSIGRPIGVWVGVLNKADQELMESAACALKAMGGSMVLIGPAGDWEQESMSRHENIYWIGPKPTNQIPAYLLHSDFGLMLYDRTKQDVYKGQNPLKLYEYLAAGLTVLSTDHDEFEFLDPPVHIVKQPHDISKTINPKTDLEAISKLGRRYVESRCWTNVVSRAECVIKSLVEANND